MDGSNTADNRRPSGKPFAKGDPRINRKGRPRNFDALRDLALEIAHEPLSTKDGAPLLVNGKRVTVTEFVLRKWANSQDPRQQQAFIEIAYGRVPTVVTGKDGGAIELRIVENIIASRGDDTGPIPETGGVS